MLAVLACAPGVAGAQRSGSSVAATAQFDKGRTLMKQKKYAEACAAFEHSQALDPQQGTLYNLAICYSLTGKLASSWASFRELAQRDSNAVRRKDSTRRAAALEKRLPRLVIAADVPGLAVTLDGVDVTPLVNTDNPVDLGAHKIHATAPGRKDADTTASITDEGVTVTVALVLPAIDPVGPAGKPAKAEPAVAAVAPRERVPDAPAPSHRRMYGLIVVGAGVALAATGLVFGKRAGDTWDDAKALCGSDRMCDDSAMLTAGNKLVTDARRQANLATGLVIGGGVALAAGVVLFVTAPRGATHRATAWNVVPSADGVTLSFGGQL